MIPAGQAAAATKAYFPIRNQREAAASRALGSGCSTEQKPLDQHGVAIGPEDIEVGFVRDGLGCALRFVDAQDAEHAEARKAGLTLLIGRQRVESVPACPSSFSPD